MQNWKRFTVLKIKFYKKNTKYITIEYVTKRKNEKKKKERMKNLYRKEFKVSMIFVC